jgi:hypothetical protein
MKKLISLIACFFLITIAQAQTATKPSGSGTIKSPYQIATLSNLCWLSQYSDEWGKYFIQTADIDASAISTWNNGAGWSPMGYYKNENDYIAFTGSYNGKGHVISGLTINRPSTFSVGLWGCIAKDAIIDSLGLVSVNVTGYYFVGGLIGYNVDATVSNCYVTGSVNGALNYIGGLIGSNGGNVKNCNASGTVSGKTTVGGLIGYNYDYTRSVQNCFTNSNINGGDCLGGLMGYNGALVRDCHASGNVSGVYLSDTLATSNTIGGLIGFNADTVRNCYSTVSVVGGGHYDYQIGGLMGLNYGTVNGCYANGYVVGGYHSECVGGLIGLNEYESKVYNCHATGNVVDGYLSQYIGGLIGKDKGGTVSSCYATGSIGGGLYAGYIGGLIGYSYSNLSDSYARGNVSGWYGSIGGLLGLNYADIKNCYSTGAVVTKNTKFAGGLVGYNSHYLYNTGIVNYSFWDSETSGLGTGCAGHDTLSVFNANGKTTAEMKTVSTFTSAGWDFTSIWSISSTVNDGYPYLRGQNYTGVDNVISSSNVFIYPNPAAETFRMSGIDGNVTILMFDLYGRTVLAKEITADEPVAVNSLPVGIYIVSVKSKNVSETRKLIIKR